MEENTNTREGHLCDGPAKNGMKITEDVDAVRTAQSSVDFTVYAQRH